MWPQFYCNRTVLVRLADSSESGNVVEVAVKGIQGQSALQADGGNPKVITGNCLAFCSNRVFELSVYSRNRTVYVQYPDFVLRKEVAQKSFVFVVAPPFAKSIVQFAKYDHRYINIVGKIEHLFYVWRALHESRVYVCVNNYIAHFIDIPWDVQSGIREKLCLVDRHRL